MSQTEIVKTQLREKGEVTRNWCLRNYISRLSAIILNLKNLGWEFKTQTRDGDYVYTLIKDPTQFDTEVYTKEAVEERLHNYHNPKLI